MSPRLDIDLTEAKDFSPVPDDVYDCHVTDVSEVQQGPNARYVSVEFTIASGDHAERKLWRNYPIEGPGASFFSDLWRKVTGEELEIGEVYGVNTDDLLHEEVQVVTEQEEYEGEMRSQVQKVLSTR